MRIGSAFFTAAMYQYENGNRQSARLNHTKHGSSPFRAVPVFAIAVIADYYRCTLLCFLQSAGVTFCHAAPHGSSVLMPLFFVSRCDSRVDVNAAVLFHVSLDLLLVDRACLSGSGVCCPSSPYHRAPCRGGFRRRFIVSYPVSQQSYKKRSFFR